MVGPVGRAVDATVMSQTTETALWP